MSKKAENSQKAASVKKKTAGSFKPGKSGNPGGRPKKTEALRRVEEIARDHTEVALRTLVAIMSGTQFRDSARVSAACAILDRGWGRAPQTVEIGNKDEKPFEVASLNMSSEMATQIYLERVRGQVPK